MRGAPRQAERLALHAALGVKTGEIAGKCDACEWDACEQDVCQRDACQWNAYQWGEKSTSGMRDACEWDACQSYAYCCGCACVAFSKIIFSTGGPYK